MSIFKRNSVKTPPSSTTTQPVVTEKKSLFGSNRKSISGNTSNTLNKVDGNTAQTGHHLFSRQETLSSAHTKLKAAVAAEAAADAALIKSRELVKIARTEITRLEREAKEEARIASAHMKSAAKFRKEGDKLGKH